MMKVPPLSLVPMERLPLPLPFSPDLLWRYNALSHPASPAFSGRPGPAPIPSPLATQLPFAYDIKHTIPLNLASDPRLWSREDVMTFMHWCEREFDLPSFDADRFQMNGKALCLLTKSDLESRTPCSGDVIHNALQILMSSSPSESPLTPHTPSSLRMQLGSGKGWTVPDLPQFGSNSTGQGTTSVTLSPAPSLDGAAGSPPGSGQEGGQASSSGPSSAGGNSDDSEYDSGESPDTASTSPPPASRPQTITKAETKSFSPAPKHQQGQQGQQSQGQSGEGGEYNNNGRLLWDFLQQLLNDPAQRYGSFITWKNVETGIFKIVDPPGLARLWGIQKNHLSMNYDKMSRALRYYYRVNILRKVQGERHCYQFLRNPGELKSIKNISMLRHQSSPMSLTMKGEPGSYEGGSEYEQNLSLFRGRKVEPEEGRDFLKGHQTSPMSLTKKQAYLTESDGEGPVQLTVKMEPGQFMDQSGDEYDDTPTDLSMDTKDRLEDD